MDKIDNFFKDVVGVVEATSFEQLSLWQQEHDRLQWKENLSGRFVTIGYVNDMPVCLNLQTAEINGYKILFINATSQIVDYRMIDPWLSIMLPLTAFRKGTTDLNKVDAVNFHNVFEQLEH